VTVEEDRDGPKPSQRAADSLTAVSAFALQLKASCTYSTSWQLVNFAETTSICRHVVRSIFICVFLESDISSRAFADTLANLLMPTTRTSLNDTVTPCVMYAYPFKIGKAPAKGDVYGLLQVCKYPDKTKRGKLKLSTEEFASTQVAQQHINDEDEDRHLHAKTNGQANAVQNSGWKTNFRDHDDHRRMFGAGVSTKGHDMSNHHNVGTNKRFNSEASSTDGSKRPKLLHPAPMLLSKLYTQRPHEITDMKWMCGVDKHHRNNLDPHIV
jgi:hypothetical protein